MISDRNAGDRTGTVIITRDFVSRLSSVVIEFTPTNTRRSIQSSSADHELGAAVDGHSAATIIHSYVESFPFTYNLSMCLR